MKSTELRDMAIEMKRAIEAAHLGLDERLDEIEASEEDREKAFAYLHRMEQAFEKRYVEKKG